MWLDRSKEKRKGVSSLFKSISVKGKKKKRLQAHKKYLESSKVLTGSQSKADGTGSQEELLALSTMLN